MAVTLLDACGIAAIDLTTTMDIQFQVPGFVMGSYGSLGLPSMRGVGSDNLSIGLDSSFPLYVDGV